MVAYAARCARTWMMKIYPRPLPHSSLLRQSSSASRGLPPRLINPATGRVEREPGFQ